MKKGLIKKIIGVLAVITIAMSSVVMAATKSAKFNLSKFTMKLGTTQSISGIMNYDEIDVSNFTSSDSTVVLVQSNGILKAVGTGIATLTYTYTDDSGNEKEIYCYVEVSQNNSTYSNIAGDTETSKVMITLNLGDYTTTIESSLGAVYNLPEVTKEGYVLEGWYKEPTYLTKIKENERASKDITLYAKWITTEEAQQSSVPHSSLYDDIDYHWARNYIESVSYRGLFNGVSDKIFSPDSTMTRAMVITVLGRLDEVELTGRTTDFSDVLSGAYYEEYVAWGVENGIVEGTSTDKFSPNKEITREEMAVMMANYIKYKKYDYELKELYYSDVDDISDWALESVKILNDLEIMQGNTDGTYSPKKVATRAEIATIFYNYLNYINR